MPSMIGASNVSQVDDEVRRGDESTPDGGGAVDSSPVLVNLSPNRLAERQCAIEDRKRRDDEEFAVKEQQIALEKEASKKQREQSTKATPNKSTPNLSESVGDVH